MKKHYILNEIARPNTLDTFICHEGQKNKFKEYIEKQDIPHIGLFGRAGSGKTTLAKIFVKNIDCDYIILNATEDRSIDSIKDKIGTFCAAGSFKSLKIVILDESTHLLEAGQVLLLNMMETFSLNTRFILTGNFPERLIEPLRSRLQEFELIPPSKRVMAEHVCSVLDKEEITYKLEDIGTIINKSYPDLRKVFNNCQKFIIDNELNLGKLNDSNDEYKSQLIDLLKSPKTNITSVRQLLVNTNKSDYEDVYKFLYDSLDDYGKGKEGEIIITLEEGLHKSQTRLNKEINIMSTLSKILNILI